MANEGIKPTDFPLISTIDGSEELYTQTGGVNGKFLVSQILGLVPTPPIIPNYSITPIKTGRQWIDGKSEWEVVIFIDGFVSGNDITHNFNINQYISVEAYTWIKATPTNKIALIRNDDNGNINNFFFTSLTTNTIEGVNTSVNYDQVLFILKFTVI